MKILALDTALGGCSVAVLNDRRTLAHEAQTMARGQAEMLLPMIERAMHTAGLDYAALDRLAVTIGPGSFTGLRIGLSTARALALATDRPLVGITTLEAIAQGTPAVERTGRTILVVLDSRRGDFFIQGFDSDIQPLTPPQAVAPDDLAALFPGDALLLAGDAAGAALAVLHTAGREAVASQGSALPDARLVGALAALQPLSDRPVAPLYLRAPDVSLPKAAILQIGPQ